MARCRSSNDSLMWSARRKSCEALVVIVGFAGEYGGMVHRSQATRRQGSILLLEVCGDVGIAAYVLRFQSTQ